MVTRIKVILLVALAVPVSVEAQADAAKGVIWDVAELGLFDVENKLRGPEHARVLVDLDNAAARCPRAIGPGLPKEVALRYRNAAQGKLQFHVLWHPGDSGKEQFEVLVNGKKAVTSALVDASAFDGSDLLMSIPLDHQAGSNEITIRFLTGDGLYLRQLVLSTKPTPPRPLRPELKFPTLASYAKEIKEPAVILDDDNVRLYAPKAREKEARIIFPYLVKAYSEYYRIVGIRGRGSSSTTSPRGTRTAGAAPANARSGTGMRTSIWPRWRNGNGIRCPTFPVTSRRWATTSWVLRCPGSDGR